MGSGFIGFSAFQAPSKSSDVGFLAGGTAVPIGGTNSKEFSEGDVSGRGGKGKGKAAKAGGGYATSSYGQVGVGLVMKTFEGMGAGRYLSFRIRLWQYQPSL